MTRKSLLIALGLSLLFNVFVLVGFVTKSDSLTSNSAAPDNKQTITKVASELQLTDGQAKLLAELREDHRKQATVFDESLALVQQGMVTELRKENPDLTKLRSLVEQEAELYRQRRLAGAELFGKFVGELDPQQRRKLTGRVPHGPRAPQIPRMIMERFDRNHNGRLDPDEFQDARQEMERRRRDAMHGPPPPRMPSWRQFDANHDGKMDEQELAAMDEFQRQRERERERDREDRERKPDFDQGGPPPPPNP